MRTIEVSGVTVPAFMYGTAWKEDDTARCVLDALRVGFRAIDTANQRKHYDEAAVGRALARAQGEGLVTRAELFLQTKFTDRRAQDHRLPYDPRADLATQVEQSLLSSREHLGVDVIDAYVLHGPSTTHGLTEDDWRVWDAMESLQRAGHARLLGVSNINRPQLVSLLRHAEVRPSFVQNRCYARTRWDADVRELCARQGVVYQGFSLLTANRDALRRRAVAALCRRHGRTPAQIVFRFAQQVGMLPLTGTTDPAHMREDLHGLDFELAAHELATIERLALSPP